MICNFKNNYNFLSNFYINDININNKIYKSVEHAYQSFKTENKDEHEWIRNSPTPHIAKRIGQKVKKRKNWDDLKYKIMLKLIRFKFKDLKLKKMLLTTNNEELIEGNYWHDNIWGNCTCEKCKNIKGKNWLGKILMKVRDEIK